MGELRGVSTFKGIVLVEYSSREHPERIFADLLASWERQGVVPLIVDIWDTLHSFVQNLRFQGIELNVARVPVIKERGVVNVGNVLGKVEVIDDFEYHMAVYSRLARKVPQQSRKHTIVLGIEKFSFTFIDDPPKLERYFEKVTRLYLPVMDKTSVLFLNVDIASYYLVKGLEQDSDYVLRLKGRELKLLKHPEAI